MLTHVKFWVEMALRESLDIKTDTFNSMEWIIIYVYIVHTTFNLFIVLYIFIIRPVFYSLYFIYLV